METKRKQRQMQYLKDIEWQKQHKEELSNYRKSRESEKPRVRGVR